MAKNIIKIKEIKFTTILLVAFIVLTLSWLNLFNFIGSRHNAAVKFIKGKNEARAAMLDIKTDKEAYQSGEVIKINFLNNSRSKLQENTSSSLNINAKAYLGENYGVGLIEFFDSGRWLAVEPVWRCDESCYNPCPAERLLEAGEKKEFFWNQKTLKCNGLNIEAELEDAAPGRYRVSTAVWDATLEDYKIVSSNEFEIK